MTKKTKTKAEREHFLGDLDETTRLVSWTRQFVIKKRVQAADGTFGAWKPKYYYTSLRGVMEGHVRRGLRGKRVEGVQGDLARLVSVIEEFRTEVAALGDRLDLEWKELNPEWLNGK